MNSRCQIALYTYWSHSSDTLFRRQVSINVVLSTRVPVLPRVRIAHRNTGTYCRFTEDARVVMETTVSVAGDHSATIFVDFAHLLNKRDGHGAGCHQLSSLVSVMSLSALQTKHVL